MDGCKQVYVKLKRSKKIIPEVQKYVITLPRAPHARFIVYLWGMYN